MILQQILRAVGGAALSSKTVTVKKVSDDSSLGTATTGTDGLWTFSQDYNPAGRLYWIYSDGTTTRRGSSQEYGMVGPNSLYEFTYLLQALGDGVVANIGNSFTTTATGTRQVATQSGAAIIKGVIVNAAGTNSPATAGSANATGSTRIDTLVIEVTRPGQTEEGKAILKIVEGTTSAPSLTQTSATWQFPLYNLSLANDGGSYTISTDRRVTFLTAAGIARNATLDNVGRITSTTPATISSTSYVDLPSLNAAITPASGVVYDITLEAFLSVTPGAQVVSLQPYIDTTNGTAADSSGAGQQTLFAAVALDAYNGLGSAITAGARVKTTGGSPTSTIGLTIVRAVPRW